MSYLKISYFTCLFLFLNSCSFFTKKQQKVFVKTDTIIDFTSVDTYPLLPNCEEIIDSARYKNCFYSEIYKQINKLIQPQLFQNIVVQDTILLQLQINKQGKVHLINTKKEDLITKPEIKKIDSILRIELQKIPPLQPATKRGIPVTAVFTLPLILVQ